MANIKIAHVKNVHHDTSDDGAVPCLVVGNGETYQTVAIGASSAQSAVLSAKYVRIYAEDACYLRFGDDPTASTTNGIPMAAGTTEVFAVWKEGVTKAAVIED